MVLLLCRIFPPLKHGLYGKRNRREGPHPSQSGTFLQVVSGSDAVGFTFLALVT